MFEIGGRAGKTSAEEALKRAAMKMPMECKVCREGAGRAPPRADEEEDAA